MEVQTNSDVWKIVYRNKVAVALNPEMHARWEKGGSKAEGSADGRSMKVIIPKEGTSPGFEIIAAYGPTGTSKKQKKKGKCSSRA